MAQVQPCNKEIGYNYVISIFVQKFSAGRGVWGLGDVWVIGWAMVSGGGGIRSFRARGCKKSARSDLMKKSELAKKRQLPMRNLH